MKKFISILSLLVVVPLFAEHSSNSGLHFPGKKRPQVDGLSFSGVEAQLTAEDINSGDWKPSEDGGCDLEKGCPYVNSQGVVRYLPNSEKAKLKKTEPKAAKSQKEIGPIPSSQLSSELKKLQEAGIEKVVIAYGDEATCPYCGQLGEALRRALSEKTGITMIKVNKVSASELPDPSRKIIPQVKAVSWNGTKWVEGFKKVGFPPDERSYILSELLK